MPARYRQSLPPIAGPPSGNVVKSTCKRILYVISIRGVVHLRRQKPVPSLPSLPAPRCCRRGIRGFGNFRLTNLTSVDRVVWLNGRPSHESLEMAGNAPETWRMACVNGDLLIDGEPQVCCFKPPAGGCLLKGAANEEKVDHLSRCESSVRYHAQVRGSLSGTSRNMEPGRCGTDVRFGQGFQAGGRD